MKVCVTKNKQLDHLPSHESVEKTVENQDAQHISQGEWIIHRGSLADGVPLDTHLRAFFPRNDLHSNSQTGVRQQTTSEFRSTAKWSKV